MKLIRRAACKKSSFLLVLLACFISCKKDSVPNPNTTNDVHITAAYAQDAHYLRFDSLNYDDNGRLIRIRQSTNDTAENVQFPLTDSINYEFTFSGSSTVPSTYKVSSYSFGTANPVELHALYYDDQNRIVKDSILNSPVNTNVSFTYRYDSDTIVYNVFSNTNTGIVNVETDSLFTDAAGNLTSGIFYYLDYSGQANIKSFTTTYSSYANPFFDKTLSKSLGLFLSQLLSYDFISPNMFNSNTMLPQTGNPETLSYTWTTDAKGRIVKGVEPSGQYGYAFRYSN